MCPFVESQGRKVREEMESYSGIGGRRRRKGMSWKKEHESSARITTAFSKVGACARSQVAVSYA
jgi:hypothetical protein